MTQFTRFLFFGIAIALTGCEPPSPAGGAAAPRFQAQFVQSGDGPSVVRFDTATGALQRAALLGTRNWSPLGEPVLQSGPAGRFEFDFAQTKSIPLTFIRIDTETGDVWRMSYPRDRDWVEYRSPGEKAPKASAPGPGPKREARNAASPGSGPVAAAPAPATASTPKARPGQTEEDIPAYVQGIESKNLPAEMRAWAVEQLGNVKSSAAVGPLVTALGDDDPMVLRSAIRALAKHDDPRVKPALEQMTQHEVPEIARVAEATLSSLR